jgi:two-component system response regulator DevR
MRTPPLGAVRVVLVEDHPVIRDQLTRLLHASGLEVLAAVGTLGAGLDAVTRLRPDVAIIDTDLPDGSGLHLCRTLSGRADDVALVLHAGVATPMDFSEALIAGASALVLKSITSQALLDTVHRIGRR